MFLILQCFFYSFVDGCRRFYDVQAIFFYDFYFGFCGIFCIVDDCISMAYCMAFGSCLIGNKINYRFSVVFFDVVCSFSFYVIVNFINYDDVICVRVIYQ